ncbi:Jacalin-related lectin 19 [Bienertia sinuspersici]
MKIAVGPWGGNGGTDWDDGCYSGVKQIKLVYDRCIDSITVVYDKNGKPVKGEKHGGNGGTITVEIKLTYPEEYLISISGHYSSLVHGMPPVIRSLTFKSNKRTFGPFGVEEGIPFYFPMEGGRIIGFKGRSGWYLDSIGFYLSRVQSKPITKRVQRWLQKSLEPKGSKQNQSASM